MNSVTRILLIAVDVIIVCLIISIIFYQYNSASRMASAELESLNKMNSEFNLTTLKTLEGAKLEGSSIVSAIRKYVSDMDICIVRANGNVSEIQRKHHFFNAESDPSYIAPYTIFTCAVEYSANGVPSKLVFTEKGSTLNTPEDDVTLESAKQMIQEAVNDPSIASVTKTWAEISNNLNNELSLGSKQQLKDALGTDSDLWGDLATEASDCITELKSKLATANASAESFKHKSLSIDNLGAYTESINVDTIDNLEPIGFTPKMVVVQTVDTGVEYYYVNDGAAVGGRWSSMLDEDVKNAYENGSTFNKLVLTELTNSEGKTDWYLLNYTGHAINAEIFYY